MAKTRVRVGDKVIKLREERQLLARFLVIQQTRPELVPHLPATIGDYEMAVTPRSMFASDGSLLIPTDKSSIIHAVEEAQLIQTSLQATIQAPLQETTQSPHFMQQHKMILNMAFWNRMIM